MRNKEPENMTELHPVEAAWRRFRNSEQYALLWRSIHLQGSFLDFIGLKSLPPEIVLPGAVPLNLILERSERTPSALSRPHTRIIAETLLANTVHVWAAYRGTKTIYEIEPPLGECLSRSPWPQLTPTAALRLPSHCPVFCLSSGSSAKYFAAVYDLLTDNEASGILELRISQLKDEFWFPISILHLNHDTLSQCADAAAADAQAHGAPQGANMEFQNKPTGLILTILLYLAGEPDIVHIVHPGEKPIKDKLARRDPERYRDLHEPTTHTVGRSFARALERWEIEHKHDPGVETGRTVRPHMRKAHSHLYWTGEGRLEPRVKFLLPISVTGGQLIEEPEEPLIRPTR